MKLSQSHKRLIMDNIHILEYCNEEGIDIHKLHQCDIDREGDTFTFILNDSPKLSKEFIGYNHNNHPDTVLKVISHANGSILIQKTPKTFKLLKTIKVKVRKCNR